MGVQYPRETPVIAGLGKRNDIPVVLYAGTRPGLPDWNAYPAFCRKTTTDGEAAVAIVQLFVKYNWISRKIIYQNDVFRSWEQML